MQNVVLIIHLLLAISLIGLVLLQRSEGGGLGMGGGGAGGGAVGHCGRADRCAVSGGVQGCLRQCRVLADDQPLSGQ